LESSWPLKTFFFIDARVENYQAFVAGLQATDSWVILNADQDGLDQMVRALNGESAQLCTDR
jgi:hypothetical protein